MSFNFKASAHAIPLLLLLISNSAYCQYSGAAGNSGVPGFVLQRPANVVGPYSTYFPPGNTGLILDQSFTRASSAGISIGGSGSAVGVMNGTNVKIPVSIATTIPKTAAVEVAMKGLAVARRLAGPLGLALTGWEIYNAIKDSGVKTCPAPDFFCTSATVLPTAPSAYPAYPNAGVYVKTNGGYNEYLELPSVGHGCAASYPAGFKVVNYRATPGGGCPYVAQGSLFVPDLPPDSPATDPDIAKGVGDAVGKDTTGGVAKNLWDGAEGANGRARGYGADPVPPDVMIPPGSPTVVTAPPVTVPDSVSSTRNFTDANGVPQVQTITQGATITPTSSGTGTSTTITYNVTYVTSTSTSNNTQNSTTNPATIDKTTSNVKLDPVPIPVVPVVVTNPSSPSSSTPAASIPNDYNKEVTQKQILAQLDGTGMPSTSTFDKTGDQDKVTAQNTSNLDAAKNITAGSIGLFDWFPHFPAAVCVDPRVTEITTKRSFAVPICDAINIFSKLISAIICVLAMIGSVREIQSALKA